MRRLCLVAIILATVMLLPHRAIKSATAGGSPQGVCYLPLVHNGREPTPTPTPSPTPTPLPAAVRIAAWCSQFDVPGADGNKYDEEYVCFENYGGQTAQMLGWQVRDETGFTYTFPAFALPPKQSVRLHTGSGTDTATDVYWGLRHFVWNNAGDTVYLYDDTGTLIDQYTY